MPLFKDQYPQIDVRLRLSGRPIDVVAKGIDPACHLGLLDDSALKVRQVADCPRLLCAAPAHIDRRGNPADGAALVHDKHDCLNLRFPGAKELQWSLQTEGGTKRFEITGPFESDDGDVLAGWALDGRSIVLKPIFEVAPHLRAGRLVPVATATPPRPTQLSALSQHRRLNDPKVRLFTDFMTSHDRDALRRETEASDF